MYQGEGGGSTSLGIIPKKTFFLVFPLGIIKFRGKELRSCRRNIRGAGGEKIEDELRPSGNEQEEGEEGFLWRKLTVLLQFWDPSTPCSTQSAGENVILWVRCGGFKRSA